MKGGAQSCADFTHKRIGSKLDSERFCAGRLFHYAILAANAGFLTQASHNYDLGSGSQVSSGDVFAVLAKYR